MDSTQLASVLEKRIALLPGGRDRRGGAIIAFPSHGEFVEFSYADVVSVLSYYAQIPEESVRARGYTVIIDMRHAWIRYLKTMLKAIQHVLYGKVRQTIIVKPEQFLEKQRIIIDLKLEVYEYKISLVSLHKLSRHVDINQLPTVFNGNFAYDHKKWLDLRLRYEAFLREAAAVSKLTDTQTTIDASTSKSSSSDSLEFSSPALPTARVAEEVIAKGKRLLEDLALEADGSQASVNPDLQAWAERVETLIHQIQGKQDSAKLTTSEKEKTQREQTEKAVYEQFVMGVNNVSDWLSGPGDKWLSTLHEIGESTDEAEQLKRDHEQLKNKALEIESQTGELRLISDELLALSHPQSSEISRKRDHLENMTKGFVRRVERQGEVVRMSVRFHTLIDEFTTQLDDMLENLCSEVGATDAASAQSAIDGLDLRVSAMEKAYEDVVGQGEYCLRGLTRRDDAPRDYLPGIVHVRHMLSYLQDRHQRSRELADVRRLKLQQMLQLFTCENDGAQAIKWLRDLCDTLLTQRAQLGTSAEEAAAIRRDHQKLEQTAKSTYEYGRQLVHISSVLRRSLRFEMAPNFELAQRLEEAWLRFCRGLSEQASRLNLAQAFYHTVRRVGDHTDSLCARLADELAADQRFDTAARSRSAGAVLQRYEAQRRELAGDANELRHIGEALIARMEHPADTKELAHVNHAAIGDVRRRLEQVEKKLRVLDSHWSCDQQRVPSARLASSVAPYARSPSSDPDRGGAYR